MPALPPDSPSGPPSGPRPDPPAPARRSAPKKSGRERRFVTALVTGVAAVAALGAWWGQRTPRPSGTQAVDAAVVEKALRAEKARAAANPQNSGNGTVVDLDALTQKQVDHRTAALKAEGLGIAAPLLPDNRPETLRLEPWIGRLPPRVATQPPLSEAAQLGALIFVDRSLSASGKQSCATCHDPGRGFSSPFAGPVAPGGAGMDQQGTRLPQPLRYATLNPEPQFTIEPIPEADGGGFEAAGGFFWDGRATSLADQAQQPFLTANEMANRSPAEVQAKLARSPYFARLEKLYGATAMADPAQALASVGHALMQYQREDLAFAPFSSRFDDYLRGQARLTPAQQRGLEIFNNPAKGNCIACHLSVPTAAMAQPLFTDFTYDSLGVPRNPQIAPNRDPAHFDLGLCEVRPPALGAVNAGFCGAFRVPSLRNVAVRSHYFHNGRFDNLRTVMEFYVQRDTHPERWYPRDAKGRVQLFDDLPAAYKANVNRTEPPYDRKPGQAPALDAREIDDLLSFLATLTDADLLPQAQQEMARQGIVPK